MSLDPLRNNLPAPQGYYELQRHSETPEVQEIKVETARQVAIQQAEAIKGHVALGLTNGLTANAITSTNQLQQYAADDVRKYQNDPEVMQLATSSTSLFLSDQVQITRNILQGTANRLLAIVNTSVEPPRKPEPERKKFLGIF